MGKREGEEAKEAVVAKDPGCPIAAGRGAHDANHVPFRSWCRQCVGGRGPSKAHQESPGTPQDRSVPELPMDYGFLSRTEEGEVVGLEEELAELAAMQEAMDELRRRHHRC